MPLARLFRNSPRWTILVILAVVILAAGLLAIRPGSRSRRVISHFACNFVCTKCNTFEPIDFDIEFFGLRYRGRTDNLIDRQILQFGAFEKPMLYYSRDVAAALGSDGSYVDVGANVGQYSLFMSKYVRRVHSFEPYPPVLERFRDLVALSGDLRRALTHLESLDSTGTCGADCVCLLPTPTPAADGRRRVGPLLESP